MAKQIKMQKQLILFFILLLLPVVVFAHEEGSSGFMAGLTHPVLGLDHLLAMLSVGILSAQIGGKAIWTVPLTFIAVMWLGGIMGIGSDGFSWVEKGIALSVVVLGTAIAFDKQQPLGLAMIGVGAFAFLHGHAHGVEMPKLATPYLYAIGFILGTTLIHLVGVLIGVISGKIPNGRLLLRFAGAFIAGMGLQILIG